MAYAALLAAAVPALIAALVVLQPDPDVIKEPFVWDTSPTPISEAPDNHPLYARTTIHIKSVTGDLLEAWHYQPRGAHAGGKPPVLVMAHGLGGQKDIGLYKFAGRFAEAGLAVLLFDYRSFGGSEGQPRHWASPRRHLEDWQTVVEYVQQYMGDRVDVARLALWGTSFAGGHVMVTAAKFGRNVSAVIAQVPFLSGADAIRASIARRGVLGAARVMLAGLHDRLRAWAGLSPEYIKLAGLQGELALMQMDAGELLEYFTKQPKRLMGGWRNAALARLTTEMTRYNPIGYVAKVPAPILIVSATRDSQCPHHFAERAAKLNSNVTLLAMDVSHFQVYLEPARTEVEAAELAFLEEHVGPFRRS